MTENVSPELRSLAYEVTIEEGLYPTSQSPGEVLSQLVGKFVKKNLRAEIKRVESRLDDPDEDQRKTLETLNKLRSRFNDLAGNQLDSNT